MPKILRASDPSRPGLGPVAGTIRGDVLDLGTRCESRHKLRNPAGWGVDAGVLGKAEKAGCGTVRLFEAEQGREWTTSVRSFRAHGLRVDRGRGVQLALPEKFWTTDPPLNPAQLHLFAENETPVWTGVGRG